MKNLAILFVVILFYGCSKDDSAKNQEENSYHQNPEVAENVIVLSSENSNLLSSETDLSNGVYILEFNVGTPLIRTNDIIVGDEGEGFLRKVISASSNGNIVTIQTSQATIDDLFNNATIEFSTDISDNSRMANPIQQSIQVNYMREGVSIDEDGLEYDFSNTVLYEEAGLNFQITSGTATFTPNFNFKADYSFFGGLDYLSFGTNNATLNIDCDLSLNASGNINLPAFSETLADFDKRITFLVAGLPVVILVNTQLVAELSAGIDANVLVTSGFTNNYTLTSGIKYEDENWIGNFDLGSTLTPKPIDLSGQVNISQNLTITPKVSVKFYSVIGPYCQPKMTEDFSLNVASPSLDWDSNIKVGLDLTTGINVNIFGFNIDPYSRTDNFQETIWTAPDTIENISGNDQTGTQGEQLAEPLKVRVFDSSGLIYLKEVPVYFNVTSGNGTVDNQSVMTDENGYAEVNWTLGNSADTQTVEVTVKKADGENIASVIVFNATSGTNIFGTWTIDESSDCVGSSGTTFTDNYNGPVTLNEDYTVTMEDDSNGNYLSNTYTFENNVLTINATYQEFFEPMCNGVNSRIANYSAQYNYDSLTDTFSGTTQSNQEGVSGLDELGNPCSETGNSCNGTATLTR